MNSQNASSKHITSWGYQSISLGEHPSTSATSFFESNVVISLPRKTNAGDVGVDHLVSLFEEGEGGVQAMAEARQWVGSCLQEGRTIRALRLAAGLSQKNLADATGMRQPNICAIETGKRRPDYLNAVKLASVLGVDVQSFYGAFDLTAEAGK